MDLLVLKAMIEEAISNKFPWWFLLLICLLPAIAVFLASYLRKKGENVATKEDIKDITKKIEKVRSQYSEQLETVKASLQLSNQLKLAALDERLQKHQEAFTLWLEIIWSMGREEGMGTVQIECEEWWNKNCLYLAEKSRGAFKAALMLASTYHLLTSSDDRRKHFDTIMETGDIIVNDVNLPSLGYEEIIAPKLDAD